LQQLSKLGKQAILLEAGSIIGSKNISGGILYSKKPHKGQVTNVDDLYENFLEDAPYERKITKYILHSTSKNKEYPMDLTAAHDYQSNFGCSVLMNKLNSWFAKQAVENAEKVGGGIIPGVHVNSISFDGSSAIILTDEIDEFEVKAIIAADGVNSEVAEIVGARKKFNPNQLYQGVKVIVKLPEEIIEDRFGVGSEEGAAHLFAGDVTLNHIGGGFIYTNRDTLSLGAVYHFDSLLKNPVEPYGLIDAMIKNPMISEFIKDVVPIKKEIDKNLPQEEQLRIRFGVAKLIKTWNELRETFLSPKGRKNLIESGKYNDEAEIQEKLSSIEKQMSEKFGVTFGSDYVEAEYGAKLVPDGKRCRMETPFFKNILFVGDAAGRGVFVGPRIEGLNVGIDDGVRAANAVARALDNNDFSENNFGKYYSKLLDDSPYTLDMKQIDKDYLKIFLDAAKDVPKDIIGSRYGPILKMMSSGTFRGIAVKFANILGYDKLLPMVESEDTYVKVPIQLAERLGKIVESTYSPNIPSIADRIAGLSYNDDHQSHIKVLNSQSDFMKKLVTLCPAKCYSEEDGRVLIQHEGCVDCGTCSQETQWRHPRGEKGIQYKFG
jgi:electron transfer flavoprotein-quinone oxidoreductase